MQINSQEPIAMCENLFASSLILVWIVVGFLAHILSTNQNAFHTCDQRFLFLEITVALNNDDWYP